MGSMSDIVMASTHGTLWLPGGVIRKDVSSLQAREQYTSKHAQNKINEFQYKTVIIGVSRSCLKCFGSQKKRNQNYIYWNDGSI